MNDHLVALDEGVCDKVRPGLYRELTELAPGSKILDVRGFQAVQGREPCITSVFVVAVGGSFDYQDKQRRTVEVHNGTLVRIGGTSYADDGRKYEAHLYAARDAADAQSFRRGEAPDAKLHECSRCCYGSFWSRGLESHWVLHPDCRGR